MTASEQYHSPIEKVIGRPLPTLEQWFEDNGHTERAPDFADAMAGFADLMRRTHEQNPTGLPVAEQCFLDLWKGFQIATIELCNMEANKGVPHDVVIRTLPRVLAVAAFYSTASALKEDSPWRSISKILIEEFRFACKQAADAMTESEARARKEAGDGR